MRARTRRRMTFEPSGAVASRWALPIGSESTTTQAATWRPQLSQYLLPGTRVAAQRSHTILTGSRRPQLEQYTASGSGRGPQLEHAGPLDGEDAGASDDFEAKAERSARTLAAIMVSRSSDPRSVVVGSGSCRIAVSASAVYLVLSD